MEKSKFDRIIKRFGHTSSRRGALGLLGGMVAGALGISEVTEGKGKKSRKGGKCAGFEKSCKKKKCCRGLRCDHNICVEKVPPSTCGNRCWFGYAGGTSPDCANGCECVEDKPGSYIGRCRSTEPECPSECTCGCNNNGSCKECPCPSQCTCGCDSYGNCKDCPCPSECKCGCDTYGNCKDCPCPSECKCGCDKYGNCKNCDCPSECECGCDAYGNCLEITCPDTCKCGCDECSDQCKPELTECPSECKCGCNKCTGACKECICPTDCKCGCEPGTETCKPELTTCPSECKCGCNKCTGECKECVCPTECKCGCEPGTETCKECEPEECESSCTQGFWKNNTCRWPNSIDPGDTFPCDNNLTFAEALDAGGQTGQQAAAFINSTRFDCFPVDREDICTASNEDLEAGNEGGTCTLNACESNS